MSTKNIALVVLLLAVAYYLFFWKKDAAVVAAPSDADPTGGKGGIIIRDEAIIEKTPMPQARVNLNTARSFAAPNQNQPLPGLGSVKTMNSKSKFNL